MAVDVANSDSVHNAAMNQNDSSQINSILKISPYQRFSVSMDSLLSDNRGAKMFHSFLNSQYSCGHFLEFFFACRGFRSTVSLGSAEKHFQLAKVIYRTYIKPGTNRSVPIPHHVKHDVVHRLSVFYDSCKNRSTTCPPSDFSIFDSAQDSVKHVLAVIYYPKFLEHLKGQTAQNPVISDLEVSEPNNELFTLEIDYLQPFAAISGSPWTKPSRRRNYRRFDNNPSKDQRSSTPDFSSYCSPPFSPLPEGQREMSVGNPGRGCPTTGTPNEARCCCCYGCLEGCPRCEDETQAVGEPRQVIPRTESSDFGKDCSNTTTGQPQSNCFLGTGEDTCVVPLSEYQKWQTSSSPDRSVPLRPGKSGPTLDTCPAGNNHEDPKCADKGHQQVIPAGNDCEKPASTVHGDAVTRPNLAQTNPDLFVFLLTKRLEKVKEVHEKMEKLKLWVNQVDEKNHVSSSLMGQEDSSVVDGTSSTGNDQSLPNHEVVRPHDQVSRRAEVIQPTRTPWTQTGKTLGGKTVDAVDATYDVPMTSEDDAQGILDDHCSRIWADEKEAFKGPRRISQSTSRRSRTALASVHDSGRDGLPGHFRAAAVPPALSHQRNPQNAFTTSLRNRARAASSVGGNGSWSCTGAQAGPFSDRTGASTTNSRSDARSTTSWDSGVVPEPTCSSHVYHRQPQQIDFEDHHLLHLVSSPNKSPRDYSRPLAQQQQQHQHRQKQQRSSRDYQSSYRPPPMRLYREETYDLNPGIDDDSELDIVFPQLEEEDREHSSADVDAASLQALSSSTTELAIVNSEVTAKLVQHMTRQYTKATGQRAHSSQGHVIPVHDRNGVPGQVWSPNPFLRARRDLRGKEMPPSQLCSDSDAVPPSCHLHYTARHPTAQYLNEQQTPVLPDCQQEWEQNGSQNSQYPSNGGLLMSGPYGRSGRTRVFPTASDTSSTFDSGISSTYDQLSLGEQDNRSRRLRHWPADRRNLSVTVVTKYSRTPSVPRQPGQAYTGNYQWHQSPAPSSNPAVGALLHDPCSRHQHHQHHLPQQQQQGSLSPGNGTADSPGSAPTCAHCHPAPCHPHYHHHHHLHHHHLYGRQHMHHHHASLCQSVSNGSSDTMQGSYSSRSACSSNPAGGVAGGGQLLQHWLAYQQQSSDQQQVVGAGSPSCDSARGRRAGPGSAAALAHAAACGNLRKSFSGLPGQHRRSLTTGHRHRQRTGADDECLSEASACDLQNTATKTAATNPGGSPFSSAGASGIIVGYYLCDDPVPYRTVWTGPTSSSLGPAPSGGAADADGGASVGRPAGLAMGAADLPPSGLPAKALDSGTATTSSQQPAPSLTLGQFKQLIAKKGSYRYFFKKPSNEFGTGVVHEELTHDDTFLPLWDGKVVARVERVD